MKDKVSKNYIIDTDDQKAILLKKVINHFLGNYIPS